MALHGKLAPQGPPRLNLDRFGMPRDYATYVWLLYGKRVKDDSPARRAFLSGDDFPTYMNVQLQRTLLRLTEPDMDLIGTMYQ